MDDFDDFFDQLRGGIEKRVRDQLSRHFRVNPNADPRQIVEIQIQQERAKLEKIIRDAEEDAEEALANTAHALIEWLPTFSKELQRR